MSTPPQAANGLPPSYPGLRLPERVVLASWMGLHANEFVSFDYNVALGPGFDPGPDFSPAIRQMAVQNSRKKIDVVARAADGATLLEIKERATPGAIGQLVTYAHLWEQANPQQPLPLLKIVAARVSPGVIEAAQRVGIAVEIVPVDMSAVTGRV